MYVVHIIDICQLHIYILSYILDNELPSLTSILALKQLAYYKIYNPHVNETQFSSMNSGMNITLLTLTLKYKTCLEPMNTNQ